MGDAEMTDEHEDEQQRVAVVRRRLSSPMLIDSKTNLSEPTYPKAIFGWGSTINGELGAGGIEDDYLPNPTELTFSNKVTYISCGEAHTAFILDDGTLWTCGSNDFGQLGRSKSRTRPGLVEGLEGRTIVRVSCGYSHTLAIDSWGTCYAWGSNSHGQLGLNEGATSCENKVVHQPKMIKSLAHKAVVQIATGHSHSIMLTNTGELYTCGSNSFGQLGLSFSNGVNQSKPILIELLIGLPLSLIAAGGHHSFALSVSGSVFGWGKNNFGQLGVSDNEDKYKPTHLATLKSLGVRYITAGFDHSAFLTRDGGVFTCGNGSYGQLGHGSMSSEVLPRKVLEFGSVVYQVACGRGHTMCLTEKDKLYSFGLGSVGQLGLPVINNSASNRSSPMLVKSINYPVHSIYCGGDQSFALTFDSMSSISSVIDLPPPVPADFRQYKPETQIWNICDILMTKMVLETEPVDQDLMSRAELTFSSPACWNSSFLLPNGQHMPSTWKNMGVDLELAELSLSKLQRVKAEGLKTAVEQTIYQELLPKLPHQLKHVEILRVYVLLPLLPTFYSGRNQGIPLLLADRMLQLPAILSSTIIHWYFDSPSEQLLRLISVYKKIVVKTIETDEKQSKSQKDGIIRTCLQFLAFLHKHNKTSAKLVYNAFTIPEVTEKVEVQADYLNWLQDRTPSNRPKPFFFCDFPFVFDAQAKTILLQFEQRIKMEGAMQRAATSTFPFSLPFFRITPPQELQFLILVVSRDNIVQDTINSLHKLTTDDLKKPLKVKFVGEEGEDAGGVRKEFFMLLIREILDPKYGMFRHYDESRLIWFNESTFEEQIMYYLIGLLCGLAIYNFTIINIPFPLALYKKLLNEKVDLIDLRELNPSVGRSFEQILEYDGDDFTDVFHLSFEISLDVYGTVQTIPLKPGGSTISVTKENRQEFVDLYLNYVFNSSVQKHFEAFKNGFYNVCGSNILNLFHPQELQAMVTGNEDYDWTELEKYCTYKNGYSATDPTIVLFWQVFHTLSMEEKKQFLLFLTGSDRIPILGMRAIPICIQPSGDEKYLPVAHTCFNLLDLPRYQTFERLKYKLLQAIQHNQGFSLV